MNLSLTTATRTLLPIQNDRACIIQNNSAATIYLGGDDVTADTAATGGYVLASGREVALSNGGGVDILLRPIYAIQASGGTVSLTIFQL
jgi:hypothetical protein